jgi:cytochrome c oxidase cbb3-type subunit 3
MSKTSTETANPEVELDDELIPDHEYDGIKEYDNPIPPWLSLIFIGTIVWSLFYVVAINLGYIDDYYTNLEQNQEELALMRTRAASQTEKMSAETLQKAVGNEERIAAGETVFMDNCSNCHGKKAEGLVGPNLTDKYWIHGGNLMAIYQSIKTGFTDKGMPAWGPQLDQKQIVSTVAYIRSVQGTDPSGAKKPQGDKYEPK